MPYIRKDLRDVLIPTCSGELNYIFTKVILDYIDTRGESYQTYNDIVGALENTKLELYRRKIAPYEEQKIIQNGDVYV